MSVESKNGPGRHLDKGGKYRSNLKGILMLISLYFLPAVPNASDIYVNNKSGMDTNSGLAPDNAFRTIAKAVKTVRPGDIIHLTNTGVLYKESLVLHNVSGTENARITIDGHGSTLSGCERLNLAEWVQVGPGLYRNTVFYTANRFNADWLRIYYFLFDGKMNRMGRSRKGPNTPFKDPAALAENEWTFVEHERAFYLKINPAKKLADCPVEQPVRSNAVAISGSTSYITVKNLICTHVFNDGFGLTGTCNNLKLKNIKSLYCGDDGISAHAASRFEVEDFVSIGNATGIADSGNSLTTYNGVYIKDCVGMDLYFVNEKLEDAAHSIKNVVIECNAANPVVIVTIQPQANMKVEMDNVLILGNKHRNTDVHVDGNTEVFVRNSTIRGLGFILKGRRVSLERTIIAGNDKPVVNDPGNVWEGKDNIYAIASLSIGSVAYSLGKNNLQEYRSRSGDQQSVWLKKTGSSSPATAGGITAGADVQKMIAERVALKNYFLKAIGKKN